MNDFERIYDWLKTCPELYDLWVVSSLLEDRRTVLVPNSAASMYNVDAEQYVDGRVRYDFIPAMPYYFDVDVICYRAFYADEAAYNMDKQEGVQAVCDWLIERQNAGDAPVFDTCACYQVECLTPRPFIRNEYQQDGNPNAFLVDYAVTVRFYTDNPAKRRTVVR